MASRTASYGQAHRITKAKVISWGSNKRLPNGKRIARPLRGCSLLSACSLTTVTWAVSVPVPCGEFPDVCFAMFRMFTLAETHIETGNHKMAHLPTPVSLNRRQHSVLTQTLQSRRRQHSAVAQACLVATAGPDLPQIVSSEKAKVLRSRSEDSRTQL